MSGPGVLITAGELKGARLRVPAAVRPTSQRVREALFSHWQDRLAGASFLDLFSGSGAVGLEAASRGADRVVLVEGRSGVLRELDAACRRWAPRGIEVVRAWLPTGLGRSLADDRFALVFADPPYDFDRLPALVGLMATRLVDGGEAALEHSIRIEAPPASGGLLRTATRRYGESCLSYYQHGGTPR